MPGGDEAGEIHVGPGSQAVLDAPTVLDRCIKLLTIHLMVAKLARGAALLRIPELDRLQLRDCFRPRPVSNPDVACHSVPSM